MAATVTYQFYSETYGGGLSEAAFGLALPAAERHVRWLVGAKEPADCELVAYQRAVCAACDAFAEFGEGLDGGECDLGDTVAVIDSSRSPEWRMKARVVKRVRTFGAAVICRVTIGTVQQVDYAVASSLAADVAALQDDVATSAAT